MGITILTSNYGHSEGKDVALNIAPGAQLLISMLFVAATASNGIKQMEFKECLTMILFLYHTFVLPVSIATIDASVRTIVWECLLGSAMVFFNLLAYRYSFLSSTSKGLSI